LSVRLKNSLLSFVFCASLVSAATPVSKSAEQWRRLQGPDGASIEVLFSHGDYLFAGGYDAVFRSTDQGQSWAMVNAGIDPPDSYANQIKVLNVNAAGATRLIAGRDYDGLYISTNRGQTWRPTIIFSGQLHTLKVIGSAIFAGGSFAGGSRVLISRDNGLSWTPSNAGLDKVGSVSAFAAKGDRIYLAGNGVYVSSDGGAELDAHQ